MEIKSFLVDTMPKPAPAGAIEVRRKWWADKPVHQEEVAGLEFGCPCGCGNNSWLPIGDDGWGPAPARNADMSKLTLTPSILQTFDCKWHGHLIDGVFKSV